jgi:hypothetical protein
MGKPLAQEMLLNYISFSFVFMMKMEWNAYDGGEICNLPRMGRPFLAMRLKIRAKQSKNRLSNLTTLGLLPPMFR